jgi:hypothetical protein
MLLSFRSSKVLVISKRISQNQRVGRRRCRVCRLSTRKKKFVFVFEFPRGVGPLSRRRLAVVPCHHRGVWNWSIEWESLSSFFFFAPSSFYFLLSVMSSVMSRCLSRKSFYFVWLLIGADSLHDGSPSVVVEQRPTWPSERARESRTRTMATARQDKHVVVANNIGEKELYRS